jgi:protein arginine kinase activator
MFCEKCGKNHATTHIKTVVNGIVREYNLCENCANAFSYSGNILTGMLASMFGDITNLSSTVEQRQCPVCKSSFADIAKSGKAGCTECYKTFYNELLPYLKRVHGSTKHVGKIPNSAPLVARPKTETIEDLRAKLSQLVVEENYEQAAIVRDKIKEMEAKNDE